MMFGWLKDITLAGMPPAPVKKHCPFCKKELMTDDPQVKRNAFNDTVFYHPCPMQQMQLVVLTTKSKRDFYDWKA